MKSEKIIEDLKVMCEEIFRDNLLFSFIYGGLTFKLGRNDQYSGDLDLLIVTKGKESNENINKMIWELMQYSLKNHLKIDQEVSYANKLVITKARFDEIFSLRAFRSFNKWYIKIINDNDNDYLNSPLFLDRLFLNAITTLNYFISGSFQAYQQSRISGAKTLKKLIKGLYPYVDQNNPEMIVSKLLAPKEINYKDYLGYEHDINVITSLQQLISQEIIYEEMVKADAGINSQVELDENILV